MEIIIKKTDFSTKLYKWFWDKEDYELPNNLCSYFWLLVLAYILFIPAIILVGIGLIIDRFIEGKWNNSLEFGKCFALTLFSLLLVFFGGSMLFGLTIFFYTFEPQTFLSFYQGLGISTDIVAIVVGTLALILKLGEDISNNLIVEFIKAKKNKYCPKIHWK